jgi:hypothetical protein
LNCGLCSVEFVVRLRDEWLQTPITQGAIVHVIGAFTRCACTHCANIASPTSSSSVYYECVLSNNENLLVLYPDRLVSGTRVGTSYPCVRSSVIAETTPVLYEKHTVLSYTHIHRHPSPHTHARSSRISVSVREDVACMLSHFTWATVVVSVCASAMTVCFLLFVRDSCRVAPRHWMRYMAHSPMSSLRVHYEPVTFPIVFSSHKSHALYKVIHMTCTYYVVVLHRCVRSSG